MKNIFHEWLLLMTLLLLVGTYSVRGQKIQVHSAKVSNGEKANTNEFPFIVSLQQASDDTGTRYGHACGASILNSQYLLTAGHCVSGTKPWIVVYGGNSISDTNRKYVKVKRFHVHPQYNESNQIINNDIALVELETNLPLDGKTAKASFLEIGSIPTNFSAIVAGWGYTFDDLKNTRISPTDLMKVTVPVVDMSKCVKLGLGASSPKQICAGDGNGRDSCQGDSGGPLFYKVPGSTNDYIVIGIVSYGPIGCGTTESLSNRGIYTNVTSYLDFIRTKTTFNGTMSLSVSFICILLSLMSLIL